MRRHLQLAGTLMAAALAATAAHAQTYPSKALRVLATTVGGGTDFAARIIAQEMSKTLGQPVVVENRDALNSAVIAAKAHPDGYTLLFNGGSAWLEEYMNSKTPFTMKDFAPISLVTITPGFLVVNPSLAANSVKDLIALAKAKPGALNFASGSPGTLTQLAPELFKLMAGVNMVGIPYKGGGPALNAVVAGEVQLMFATATGASPLIRSGRLKALAVTTSQPTPLFPELPTIATAGLPDYESVGMTGAFAPAKTPVAIINRLSTEISKAAKLPEIKERFMKLGVESIGSTPAEFAVKIRSEVARMSKVIKAAGIRDE